MRAPQTVAEVMDMLAKAQALAELGITASHARVIKSRGSIPGARDISIVEVAKRRRLPITLRLLARLRANEGDIERVRA